MALFPKVGSEYFDSKDREIQKTMEDLYTKNLYINQAFWVEADIDSRFEAGDQSAFYNLYPVDEVNRLGSFSFNRIRRITNMISGHQRKNRKSTIVVPVENGDQETADQFTKVLSWCNRQDNILNTISDAFHGSLVTGLSLLHVWVDYDSDPLSGNIHVDNCGYNSFLLDPFFKKKDLSDCNFVWKRSYLSKNEALSLLPDKKDEIEALAPQDHRDGKFQYMPENFDTGYSNLLAYDEFYYKTFRKQKLLVDSQTGQTMEWKGSDKKLKRYLQFFPQITVVAKEIPTVNVSHVLQGKVLYDGRIPSGVDSYPFVPVFSYFNPDISDFSVRIQGVVRGLRDAQFIYNRRKIIELDVAESKATTGWLAKEGSLVDDKDLFKTGQGRSIMLKNTAQMSDILPIPTQDVPPSFFQLSQDFANEIQQISGVNEELLGSATDDKAGILSMLRQGSALTTLQSLFDQLDMSQRLLGKLMIRVIQENFSPQKVQRIIEQQPTKQFYNKTFGTYDAAIEDGINTATQRQMQFAQLLHLKEVGIPIPDDVIIQAATLQNKKDLIDSIKQANEQRAQAEQMQMQIALEEQKARTNLANSRAVADQGLGIERMSRIEENKELAVERRAEAQKDRTQGLLNLVKTLQEIDDIDINQLQKLLTLADMVKKNVDTEESVANKTSTTNQLAPRMDSSGINALQNM